MPLAMSNANFTAWLWSTTRAKGEETKSSKTDEGQKQKDTLSLTYFVCLQRLQILTGALVQDVVKGSIRHVVSDNDWVRGRRGLTSTKNRKDVWMRKDPTKL